MYYLVANVIRTPSYVATPRMPFLVNAANPGYDINPYLPPALRL